MQDITNYVLFARVLKAGSISAAARALGMPKSTLSRRVTELEHAQGVKLLHRQTRKLVLTDVGRAFLVHCQAIESAVAAADDVAQQLTQTPRGDLRVSCPYAITQSVMARLVPDFMRRYPEVRVQLIATNRPVNLIDEGIDVAIRVRSKIEDSSLIARTIGPSPTSLFAQPKWLAAQPELNHPLDLLKLPTLSMPYSNGRYQYELTHQSGEQLTISYQPRLLTDDMWVLREAAAAGEGIVALPNYLCRDYVEQGALTQVLPQWQLPPGIMHLVYPHRRGLLPAVRVWIDYVLEHMPSAAGLNEWLTPV